MFGDNGFSERMLQTLVFKSDVSVWELNSRSYRKALLKILYAQAHIQHQFIKSIPGFQFLTSMQIIRLS